MGECNLCISSPENKSKKAMKKHRIMKHTAKRDGIHMWRCFSVMVFSRDIPEIATFFFINSRDVTTLLQSQQIFKQQPLKIYTRFLDLERARLNEYWKKGKTTISPCIFF